MTGRVTVITGASAGIGAALAEISGFIEPQLATLKKSLPAGDDWLHEIKFDGYRIQGHLIKGTPALLTRANLSNGQQPMITGELKSKVDRIWNTMWSGGITNPLPVI